MIIIKGMNFNSYNGYKSILKDMGIINILQMNKSNQEFKMIKAECSSAEIREQLIKSGLKLDYFSLKVEDFKPHFKPIQCFNCQNFDHMADKCPKANSPTCLRCAGNHKVEYCNKDNSEAKCANCSNNHPSVDKECPVFLKKLEEKLKQFRKSNNNNKNKYTKVFSQANNDKAELTEMKKSIVDTISSSQNQLLGSITEKLEISEQKISSQLKSITIDVQKLKAKQAFIEIDKQKLINSNPASLEKYARELHKIYKFHEIDVDLNSALEYINKSGYKCIIYQGTNTNVKYV